MNGSGARSRLRRYNSAFSRFLCQNMQEKESRLIPSGRKTFFQYGGDAEPSSS